MKISKITNWMVAGAACLLLGTSCDVDPTFYSQVVPDTYYTNADAIWSRFNRPFTHWRWWVAHNDARVRLMEVGTDAMCVPTRGNDWFDGAVYQNMHHHHFMDDMSPMKDGWDLTTMGVAQSWSALEDLENIDFVSVGLTEEDRVSMINQLNVLAASVVVVPDCVSSVAPLSSADSVVSAVFSRKTLLPFSAAVKSRDAVPSTTSL